MIDLADFARHNEKLRKFYPIGMVAMLFESLEAMRAYLDEDEKKALEPVFKALAGFDRAIRAGRHPQRTKTSKKVKP